MMQQDNIYPYRINTTDGTPSVPTMHNHHTFDIYYMESGSRSYFIDDRFFTASTGDIVLIKPSSFHRIGTGKVLRTLVSFTEEFLLSIYAKETVKQLTACFETPLICPSESQRAEITALLGALSGCGDSVSFGVMLGSLLLKLAQCSSPPECDGTVSRVLKYIHAHFAEIHSIDEIASQQYLSKQHLCRLFKNATGMTVIGYLNRVKVKNACTLLKKTEKSLTEICYLSGFNSYAYFSTVLKQETGLSPLAYRKQMENP